jgi:hypothetical protein
MDAHHIFSRDDKSTRWETKNGILLCYYCHQHRLTKRPEDFRKFIIIRMSFESYNQLYEQSKNILYDIPFEIIEQVLLQEMESLKIPAPKKPKRLLSLTKIIPGVN